MVDRDAPEEPEPLHDADRVHGLLRRICFKTGPPTRVGAELEWLVGRRDHASAPVLLADLLPLLARAMPFPGGSTVTVEPGGQVELSSQPAVGVARCHEALAADVGHLEAVLAAAGLVLVPSGIDPHRPPVRQLHQPRYDAMAAYFTTLPSGLGHVMMTATASVQVNLDTGADDADVARRWHLLHVVGPALSAAFANSPVHHGRATGWKSTRQAVWLRLDPARSYAPAGADPVTAWAEYAVTAPVMMLRTDSGPWRPAPGFTFADWLAGRVAGLAPPTVDDLRYHLSTLFPPVRPRGWFEVRYLDAQAPRWWPVPVAVLATLLAEPVAADLAQEACEPVAHAWATAARRGLDDPALARAALAVFAAVVDRVEDRGLRQTVTRFLERYAARARCPADDALAPPGGRSAERPAERPADDALAPPGGWSAAVPVRAGGGFAPRGEEPR
ncbi:MAG TPA: ergothioneine biosynthesis glutamate--cysteine ligase EgtA [Intrasporangium sp.]|uniref:ergothioneine biosynthesis glutamate--cysteine ligase EgtA n=1 Tax=Intrasporangium sp. TaxID=1925024 RepID=UPI002D79D575|nr:ergothioneine biosynthesis glutamate--cysteine ligase EgtA [Intrasporangium sp.]HET7399919.1 ergothioneine biosynthesis glutamate--cysteine ligase EgtA [Intrasporangium sp.]